MRKRRIWRSPKVVAPCPVCGVDVQGSEAKPRTYCSKGCANTGRASQRSRPTKRCRQCDAALANSASTYCSAQCHQDYEYLTKTKPRIEAGLCSQNSTLKTYLARERGEACEACGGGAEWNGKPLALHVDHIDGNSDHNRPANLRLLCPNCHSQTSTFTGRNTKNTKRNRYLRRYKAETDRGR